MLTDEAEIIVSGGHGGPGKVSFFRRGRGPDGGDGGHGGDLYFQTTNDLYALNHFVRQKEFAAENGRPGGSNKKSGEDGSDLTLSAPVGTDIIDLDSNEVFPFDSENQKILLCHGGLGGLGNAELKNARMTTPLHAQHGLPGQTRHLKLILKLIADFGLIGLPNAGKSSLLNTLTAANAKVGAYPFTTLEPNLGVCDGKILADIPGLISGASKGKGLGFKFLKHIEKTPRLLHCLAVDSPDPEADYQIIRDELGAYNPNLLLKPEILLLTKTDLAEPDKVAALSKLFRHPDRPVLSVSLYDPASLSHLRRLITPPSFFQPPLSSTACISSKKDGRINGNEAS